MAETPMGERILNQFSWFTTAEECAKEAAPIFEQQKWRWKRLGIPSEDDILHNLIGLRDAAKERNRNYVESGRLAFHQDQYGFQKPIGALANSIWTRREAT